MVVTDALIHCYKCTVQWCSYNANGIV